MLLTKPRHKVATNRVVREQTSRVPDLDGGVHFNILHQVHDSGLITCACREVASLMRKHDSVLEVVDVSS